MAFLSDDDISPDARERLRWLVQLRAWALVGAMIGIGVAVAMKWRFVSPEGIAVGVLLGVVVNTILYWRTRTARILGARELALHAFADVGALTWLLLWSGGIANPITACFSFHVVLGALLSGRRGAQFAAASSGVAILFLYLVELFGFLPVAPIGHPPLFLVVLSLVLLISGLSYFSFVLAERLHDERARAHEGQRAAEQNLMLLNDALEALQVGVEVVGRDDVVELQSSFAARVRERMQLPPPRHGEGIPGRTPLVYRDDGGRERIIDVMAIASARKQSSSAVLFVDRTDARLVEQRHVMLERLATLGRALQGVAHELNTPLTTMQTLAKDLLTALDALPATDAMRIDFEESITLIVEESRRCGALTQSLLSTAHDRKGGRAGERALAVVRRAVQLVGGNMSRNRIVIDDESLQVPLPVDSDRALQILMNLIQNALKAVEDVPAGAVHIGADVDDDVVTIHITDNGPGLPAIVRERMFEPFVTTRGPGEGTGLGLYTSLLIARELQGSLQLVDAANGGTDAVLTFRQR